MPSNRKVYQKKKAIRRKFASMKFFFWPLYAISRQFKQCPHNIVSGTDGLIFKAGVSPARPFFLILFAEQDSAPVETDTSGSAKFRAGRGALAPGPLHSIFLSIVIAVLITGCLDNRQNRQPEISVQQKEARLKVIEKIVTYIGKEKQRKKCLSAEVRSAEQASKCFECHDLWKEWEQEQLRKEPDGT